MNPKDIKYIEHFLVEREDDILDLLAELKQRIDPLYFTDEERKLREQLFGKRYFKVKTQIKSLEKEIKQIHRIYAAFDNKRVACDAQ